MANIENEINSLTVFNPMTGLYEDVEVTKEVYDEYRRGEWRISKNDDRHSANETPFSALVGGDEGSFENFHEFVDLEHNPEVEMVNAERRRIAFQGLSRLSVKMRKRFILHYRDGMTVAEIAKAQGVSEYSIKDSLKRARKNLDLFFEKNKK